MTPATIVPTLLPKILEAADCTFGGPEGADYALTCEWPDGTETLEHVSEHAALVLGYDPDDEGNPRNGADLSDPERETVAAAEGEADLALFDITKQVWIFDPDDMTVTVDGVWELCEIHGAEDFPCLEEEDEERVEAEAIACGHAIAALPQLLTALHEIVKGEGAYNRDPLTHAANTIDSMKDLARAALALATSGDRP